MKIIEARGSSLAASLALMLAAFAAPACAQSTGSGAGAKVCTWFTPAEIAKYLGTAVETGKVGGPLDSLCQWKGKSDDSPFIQIQIASQRSCAMPDLADGFKRVNGIGSVAYVVPQFHGWTAGAKTATKVVVVSGVGPGLTAEKTVDLLRAAAAHQ